MIYILHDLKGRNYGNDDTLLIMGDAGFTSSTAGFI